MIDRTIPFFNIILKCGQYNATAVCLPEGFSIVSYQNGYEKDWARLEYALKDFDSEQQAEHYFISTYLADKNKQENLLFLLNPENKVIGSCIAWKDLHKDKLVSSLHWLVVDENYQKMGLGKALCLKAMNIFITQLGTPIYIHTQPWSWKAILLYITLGFKLQQTDTFLD